MRYYHLIPNPKERYRDWPWPDHILYQIDEGNKEFLIAWVYIADKNRLSKCKMFRQGEEKYILHSSAKQITEVEARKLLFEWAL